MAYSDRSTETRPLVGEVPESYNAVDDNEAITSTNHTHVNTFSRTDIIWILAGVWSALFLGALDGWSAVSPNVRKITCHPLGTVVATLMTPIGSYFNKSNQSSYIGTSYLLSLCCFTPLYGTCNSSTVGSNY